ncbi:MAG: nucleoside recognition domain-containing protein [Oscillospiraceae bacterium]
MAEGTALCFGSVLPSLFPFFVLSSLLLSLGVSETLGRLLSPLMTALFGLSGSGAGAFALGLIGGYPSGARAVSELYENHLCSREEAERLLGFCNNCGPAFLLSFVGAERFGSAAVGLQLYLIHVLAALLTGLLLRPRKSCAPSAFHALPRKRLPFSAAFVDAVQSGFSAFLSVCGFVLLFSVLLRPVKLLGGGPLLLGLIELFSGASALPATAAGFVLAAFLTGWGGLSVHAQSMAFFVPAGLSGRWYFPGKALQAVLSAALAALSLLI